MWKQEGARTNYMRGGGMAAGRTFPDDDRLREDEGIEGIGVPMARKFPLPVSFNRVCKELTNLLSRDASFALIGFHTSDNALSVSEGTRQISVANL